MYLGLSIDEWSVLADSAEESFTEKNIGQYVLGLYPIGDRLFGLQVKPRILCLYLDDPVKRLDPLKIQSDYSVYFQTQNEQFVFLSFFEWLRTTVLDPASFFPPGNTIDMLAPYEGEAIYENDAISEIIAFARTYLIAKKYNLHAIDDQNEIILNSQYEITRTCLGCRCLLLLLMTEEFLPGINYDWGEVYLLEEERGPLGEWRIKNIFKDLLRKEIINLDVKLLSGEIITIREAKEYIRALSVAKHILVRSAVISTDYENKLLKKVSEASIEYLRYLI
jgi:hypothetical protein